jgi:hypothetical protein
MQRTTAVKVVSLLVLSATAGLLAHLTLLDGIEGLVAPVFFVTDTKYSSGYSDDGFRRVSPGMTAARLHELLGEPLSEVWDYSASRPGCGFVRLVQGRATETTDQPGCQLPTVSSGMTGREIVKKRGVPGVVTRVYSGSGSGRSYRERIVIDIRGIVQAKIARFYPD